MNGSSPKRRGMTMNRTSPFLISLILIFSCFPVVFVSANAESTTISTFSGGFATVDVDLDGGIMDNSSSIDVPRNVTFTQVSFDLEIDSSDQSPGSVWVDIDEDGTFEWDFSGTGYGDLGHQNDFYNGNDWYVKTVAPGTSSTPGIMLPSSANLQSSQLNASFSPSAGGGFFAVGAYVDVVESDIDSDGNPEPIFLSTPASNFSSKVTFADWSQGSGITTSAPIYTCNNASSVSVGDLNNDSQQDIVVFSTQTGSACVHIANGSSFDPVRNLTAANGLVHGEMGDLNSDGYSELITIDSMGTLAYKTWDNASSSFGTPITQQVSPNGSAGMPANLVSLHVGDFFGNGTESALVKDQTGHWTLWQDYSGMWGGPITKFDDIAQNEILTDLDGDGDIDLIGTNDMGYALRINDGMEWDLTSFMSQIDLYNSTIADFDNDGVLDLMTPVPGFSDGNSQTVEGNISVRNINATNVSGVSVIDLSPWSIPTSLITMDMDGDGVLEQVVAAGEGTLGVFIGGYHTITLDADGDGTLEMSRSGYAGNSANGLDPLVMFDDMDGIRDDLSPLLLVEPSVTDAFGISMVNRSMDVTSSGSGEFNFTDMDIGYDCVFYVESNPHSTSNLTNVLNQGMTGGVGNYTVEIPVNSTNEGKISLTNLIAIHIPGAPNLSLPITPTLTLVSATPEEVMLAWDDRFEFGEDFVEFEIFRLSSANQVVDLLDTYNTTRDNVTTDSNVTVGSTYWYQVRSVHTFGITSNLSNILEVTIPYPSPPLPIEGLSLTDTPSDEGGNLHLTWNHSTDDFDFYRIYLETTQFTNVADKIPQSNISSSENSTTFTGLVDGQQYWAAVVAVDQYGNSTDEVNSVGPTYPRNDVPQTLDIELAITQETSIGSPFSLSIHPHIDGVYTIPHGTVQVSMQTSQGVYPISSAWSNISVNDFSELISSADQISGEVIFWVNYSGHDGDEQTRSTAPASEFASTVVTVNANLYASESSYQLDWENETNIRINLEASLSTQQSLLDGTIILWTAYNESMNTSVSGTETISNGISQFIVNSPYGGLLYVNITQPTWINVGDVPLVINLIGYGETVDQNNSDENETIEEEWSPSIMLDVTVDCGEVEIDPEINQRLDCTLANPNNYSIEVSLEADGWSQWPDYILFEPVSGQTSFMLEADSQTSFEIRVVIVENLSQSGLTSGMIELDLRQGPVEYTFPNDKPLTFDIQWTLKGEDVVVDPVIPEDNNTENQTSTSTQESSNSTVLIIGTIVGIAVIGMVVFIILRVRNSDLEDWNEDDLDMEPDVEVDRISKPLPVGVALDEFQDKTIVDESPDRPDVISDFEEDSYYEENVQEYEEEYEEEYQESSNDDSGITIDEHGTEWYEDEVGVWWYRDPGEEDWSEFVE